jgi:adenylylsulfate kinase
MSDEKHSRDRWTRSLVKAVTYRVPIIILDFTSIYLLTGKTDVALGFMIVSNIYTSVAYYLHERLWNRTDWGIKKTI